MGRRDSGKIQEPSGTGGKHRAPNDKDADIIDPTKGQPRVNGSDIADLHTTGSSEINKGEAPKFHALPGGSAVQRGNSWNRIPGGQSKGAEKATDTLGLD